MLLGEFEHNIDTKGRLIIPSKFRGRLEDGVVVTRGIDPCLWLFPRDIFLELAPRLMAPSLTKPDARELRRQVFGGASASRPDKQGRVIVPPKLLAFANIDRQAVIVGVYDHCEIWNPEEWNERQNRTLNDPEWRSRQFSHLDI